MSDFAKEILPVNIEDELKQSYLSYFKRNEIWLVSKGKCVVNYSDDTPDNRKNIQLEKLSLIHISEPTRP